MRVALLSDTFAKKMGYLESVLPRYLARYGADVHVITTDLPPYYWVRGLADTYRGFSDRLQAGTSEKFEGYTLHVLSHRKVAGYMRMVGLGRELSSLRPDIVQTMTTVGWTALDAAIWKIILGYQLFTACHTTASVFPLATQATPWWKRDRLRCFLTRTIPGRFTDLFAKRCYAATTDCADVARRFFGVSSPKIDVCPLGVDTGRFSPIANSEDKQDRLDLREKLGFSAREVVCIYTGRFTEDKNPLLLAKAVAELAKAGQPFRSLFVGNGLQAEAIKACAGCVVHPFVPVGELATFFRAADIGVWPTQESMSMLDAAACGIPIIVNHTLMAAERVEGNGLRYRLNDQADLQRALLALRNPEARQQLGLRGAEKMAQDFSWDSIAQRRLLDYQAALELPVSTASNTAVVNQ